MIATDVTLDAESHVYTRGDKRLTSVSGVIKSIIPTDYSSVDQAVLENARQRGSECDALFSAYVEGRLDSYPVGTRIDVVDLMDKLIPFWDALGIRNARAQVILADDEVAGTCDIISPDVILDLKCVSRTSPTYGIQLGAYRELADGGRDIALIHVNAAMKAPKLIELNAGDCLHDWEIIRHAWKVVRRLRNQGEPND